MSFLNNLWYGKNISALLCQIPLLPFSGIFAAIAAARRSLYANGFCHKDGPVVPVVVVGGITVGGTGKTPTCIAIANELKSRGFKPGILSRGYKSKCSNYPCQVPINGTPDIFGDEPCLMRRATKVPVVIDPKRTRGADYLAGLGVDVIITDDGLQHYALDREVEICILDGARMLGNGHLLPSGPLREAKWRLKTVDSIVVTGSVAHLGYFTMRLKQSSITPLNPNSNEVLQNLSKVCALAGIGNPDRFFKTLEDCGFVVEEKVEVSDHGTVSIERLRQLSMRLPVVMTAKDAIKYQDAAQKAGLSNIFVLNVNAELSKQFFDDVVNKIKLSNFKVSERIKRRAAAGYVLEKVDPIEIVEDDTPIVSNGLVKKLNPACNKTKDNDDSNANVPSLHAESSRKEQEQALVQEYLSPEPESVRSSYERESQAIAQALHEESSIKASFEHQIEESSDEVQELRELSTSFSFTTKAQSSSELLGHKTASKESPSSDNASEVTLEASDSIKDQPISYEFSFSVNHQGQTLETKLSGGESVAQDSKSVGDSGKPLEPVEPAETVGTVDSVDSIGATGAVGAADAAGVTASDGAGSVSGAIGADSVDGSDGTDGAVGADSADDTDSVEGVDSDEDSNAKSLAKTTSKSRAKKASANGDEDSPEKKTTRKKAPAAKSKDRAIFGRKTPSNTYDPHALPRGLKRKSTKKTTDKEA